MSRNLEGCSEETGTSAAPRYAAWAVVVGCVALVGLFLVGTSTAGELAGGSDLADVAPAATDGPVPANEPGAGPQDEPQEEEEADEEPADELPAELRPTATGEIVVTARKREETLDTVPVAVSVLSGDDLESNQMDSIADAAQLAPGLNVNSDATSRAFVSIRGIGTALFNSVEPGVGIFLDGVYLPATAYANNPVLDVERIEVLKGPQGTLYGKNTLGGAINIVTRKPTDTFEGQVSAGYFDGDDSSSGSVRLSGPIVPGVLRGRIAVSSKSSDGFFDNALIGGPIHDSDSESATGSLHWEASDSFNVIANLYYLDLSGPEVAYGSPADVDTFSDDIYNLNLSSFADATYTGGNIKLMLDAPSIDSQISAIFAHDEQELSSSIDADFSPVDMFRQNGITDRTSDTVELRIDTTWSDRMSTLFGVFGSDDERDISSVTTVVAAGLDVPDASWQKSETRAVFGTLFLQLPRDFELTLGLRYDDNEAVLEAVSDPANPRRVITTSHVAPRVSLTKFWSPERMSYVSLARGIREGGFNSTVAPENLWVIEPDEVWTLELGHKATVNEGLTHLTGAVFFSEYTDFIGQNTFVLRPDGAGFTGAVINQGDAESYGAELEIAHQITPRWSVIGDAAWVHVRATNQDGWIEATGAPLGTDRLIFQPDWTVNLHTDYSIPAGAAVWNLRAGLYGKGEAVPATQKQPPESPPLMDAYYLVNASVSCTFKNLQVQLFGSNLTDEGYWYSFIDDSLTGFNLGIQGAKRKVGLQVMYWF